MKAVARFAVTAEDRDQTRGALLARLANRIDSAGSWELMEAVARFAVTAKERAQTRGALLTLLSDAPDPRRARMLENTVTGLSPTVADLGGSDSWPIPQLRHCWPPRIRIRHYPLGCRLASTL